MPLESRECILDPFNTHTRTEEGGQGDGQPDAPPALSADRSLS